MKRKAFIDRIFYFVKIIAHYDKCIPLLKQIDVNYLNAKGL